LKHCLLKVIKLNGVVSFMRSW